MKPIQFAIPTAISLFLCSGAKAQTLQPAYGVPTVVCVGGQGLRCQNLSGHPYILVGGYFSAGDNGGGYFAYAPGSCTDNGGTIIQNVNGQCFYRTDSRAAIPVQWFGARCDAITTVYGGTIFKNSTTFTSSSVTFQQSDVGKTIELLPAGSSNPFRTTISQVNSSTTVTLSYAPNGDYPGFPGATKASFLPTLRNGLDTPGAGYKPQDSLTINGGAYTGGPAGVTVKGTGLVAFTQTSGGSNYQVNDLITFVSNTSGVKTHRKAEIQVTSVDSNGAVTGYVFVDNGDFRSSGSNPNGFTIKSTGAGTGYAISLLTAEGSFGLASVYSAPAQGGTYTTLPPIPSSTTDTTTPTASGATVDLSFPTPTWVYGSDDSTALSNIETYLETDFDRGIFNAAEVPGDHSCLLQTLQINRPVTWRSSGSRQAQLLQMLGAVGNSIDNLHYGFVLVAANLPSFDNYQDVTVGQQAVGINNIQISGGTSKGLVDINNNKNVSYANATTDGLLFQNPTGKVNSNVNAALQDLQVVNFPGNALSANSFSGEFRGYNIFAGSSAGNCVDLENTANPYRFYGLVASGCTYGLNFVRTKSEEFHGASVFSNSIDVYVSGTLNSPEAYILFDGAQFGHADNENMYLDQLNETVICAANCVFTGSAENCSGTDCGPAMVVGPDATTTAAGVAPVIGQFNQGVFSASSDPTIPDVQFDNNSNNKPCNCSVALGGGMLDVNNGTPTTNQPTLLAGQTHYAPPTFANAASIGVPLTLNPNELGIGVSVDTETAPGKSGLKLRVECSSTSGKVKLVILAGNSTTETVLADNIGDNVSQCIH